MKSPSTIERREAVARIISPSAFMIDPPRQKDSDTKWGQRESAYRDADAILAALDALPQGGVVVPGPDSMSVTGKFFLALDHLSRMTWRWGESCGIDDVSWDRTGDSYNEGCRADHHTARKALIEAFHAAMLQAAPSAPLVDQDHGSSAQEADPQPAVDRPSGRLNNQDIKS